MKKILTILILSIIPFAAGKSSMPAQDSLSVFSTPDLHELASAWTNEYNSSNPANPVRLAIAGGADAAGLIEKGQVGFASASSDLVTGSAWRMIVGRNVIVPVINSGNPFIAGIRTKGVSPSRLLQGNKDERTWGMLLGNSDMTRLHLYCLNDDKLLKSITVYLGTTSLDFEIKENPSDLMAAMRNDVAAIGFCRLADITNSSAAGIMEGISILPVDRNNDGILDHNEDIYRDLSAFTRGVWIGKYPAALVDGIYTVSSVQPSDDATVAFLKWVLDRGQAYLNEEGFTSLLAGERLAGAEKLAAVMIPALEPPAGSIFKTLLLGLIALLAFASLVILSARVFRKKPAAAVALVAERKVLDEKSIILPGGILFDKTHTWAFMEQNGLVKIGVDDFMRHVTGSISRIRMKMEGESVKKGEEIFSIVKNGRQLNLYSPVSGTIMKRNSQLENDAASINNSPYSEGWIYMIQPLNWSRESPLLMMADRHRQFISEELTRLRDFLSGVFAGRQPELAAVVLQDGGALIDGPLEDMSPEVWEEFQSKFIDPSRQVWFYELY